MERIYNDMGEVKDLSKYRAGRIPKVQNRAFEDLGSSFGKGPQKKSSTNTRPSAAPSRSSQQSNKASRPGSSTSSAANKGPTGRRFLQSDEDSDESLDEMDCLSSQAGDYDDPSSSQMPVRKSSPAGSWDVKATSQKNMNRRGASQKKKDDSEFVDANGTTHEMDQVLLSRTNALAKLKFKKNKKPEDDTPDISAPKASSSQTPKPLASEKKPPSPVPYLTYTSGAYTRTSQVKNAARPPEPTAGPTKPRPKPKPVFQGGRSKDAIGSSKGEKTGPSSSQTSSTRRALDMLSTDITPRPPRPSQRQKERSRSRSRSRSASPGSKQVVPVKRVPQAFPTISPFTTPVKKVRTLADFPDISPLGDSLDDEPPARKRDLPKKSSGAPVLREFPPISPISIASPQQRNSKAAVVDRKGKGKADDVKGKPKAKKRVIITDSEDEPSEDDDAEDSDHRLSKKKDGKSAVPKRKLAAFPMSTQVLASIDLSPERPTRISWSPSRSVKRSSEGGSGDEYLSKKPKRLQELLSSTQRSPGNHSFEEGESISLDPVVDPKSLCPYCDSPLPSSPSPLLLRLLSTTKLKSYKDARPANPLGRKAPLAVFATVCQRHRFESKILPEAERKGWPKTIDWKKIEGRIGRMKGQLQALIRREGDDSDEDMSDGWQVLHANGSTGSGSHKAKSVFWDELLEEIKKKGMKSISGVQGQFDNFEKAQPGYYGELGSVIIHQTLYNMFPPASIDATVVAPLTINQFVQRVLVPEVALRLIMEDQRLKGDSGMRQALAILRDSSAYGVAMFPEDSTGTEPMGKRTTKGDADGADRLGVGDMIVMERARKRRKELEEEEEQEEKEREREREREEQGKQEALEQAKKKGRAPRAQKEKETQHSEAEDMAAVPRPRPRPKPRPVMRSSDGMDMSSTDTDVKPSVKANAYRSPSRTRSRSKSRSRRLKDRYSGTSTDEDGMDMSSTDTDVKPSVTANAYRSPSRTRSGSKSRNRQLKDRYSGTSTDEDTRKALDFNNLQRSPSASEMRDKHFGSDHGDDDFFDQFDDTPRRAPSLEVAAMDINASDRRGNAAVKAKAKGKGRVAASSPTRSSSRRSRSKSVLEVTDSDDDPVTLSEKTPVAPRKGRQQQAAPDFMDISEDTPKGPTTALADWRRRKAKLEQAQSGRTDGDMNEKTYTRKYETKIDDDFRWLLSDSQ